MMHKFNSECVMRNSELNAHKQISNSPPIFGGEFVLCCDIYFSRYLQVTSEYELHLQL